MGIAFLLLREKFDTLNFRLNPQYQILLLVFGKSDKISKTMVQMDFSEVRIGFFYKQSGG